MTVTYSHRDGGRGVVAGATAYVIWSLFPLYFKSLVGVPPSEVLAHRVLWSMPLMSAIMAVRRNNAPLRSIVPKTWLMLTVSALCIGSNWLLYIVAAMGVHTLDASLGYFILPLISVLFGTVLLGDRLSRLQWAAVALSATGVVLTSVERGAVPLISLGIAFSFSIYGLVRNRAPVDAVTGLFVETMMLAPIAAAYLWFRGGSFGHATTIDVLLMGTAAITAIPLLLFGWAARQVTLSTLGVLQYLTPTIVFALAVFRYHEPLARSQLVAFAVIWAGLALYVGDGWCRGRRVSASASVGTTTDRG